MSDPEHLATYVLCLALAGLTSGFASGLFGIGGGALRVPIFVQLFPIFESEPAQAMHMAVGTSLALAIPAGITSARKQQQAGNLDEALLRTWIPALLVGVLIGLVISRFVAGSTLTAIFGVGMGAVGLEMILLSKNAKLRDQLPGHPILELIATSIATLSTLIGVTGGAFTTPVLTLFGIRIHRAIATAAAGSAAIAVVGTIGCIVNGWGVAGRPTWSLGYIDLVAFAVVLPTVVLSAPWGVALANRSSESRLRKTFGVFLVVISADMLRRSFLAH